MLPQEAAVVRPNIRQEETTIMALSLAFALLAGVGSLATPDIVTERVFGPEIPGPYKHPASLTELANGDLYLVYYGGSGEYATDGTVYGARLRKGATKWSAPARITPHPEWPEGNAVAWQAPDGPVWLFSVTRHGATWSTSRIVARVSTDGAHTWGEPTPLTMEAGTMVRGKPIVLKGGDYLLPIYRETGHDPERVGPDTVSLFLRYHVQTKRWTESNRIRSRLGNLQPAVAALSDDHLVCYCRRGGDYKPRTDGYLVRSESRDGGRTWSAGVESSFPNPNAAVDLLRLHNGHLLLVYNDSMSRRTPLTAALSTDGDRSYPHRRNLAEGPGDFAYPFAIQTRDGNIHVVYTSQQRRIINHAVFTEAALLNGKASAKEEAKPTTTAAEEWERFPDGSLGRATEFRGAGGLAIPAYVRKPQGAGPFPVIVLLHGGGPSRPATYAAARLALPTGDFLRAGWAVYSIDFRPNHSTVRLPPVEIDDTIKAIQVARQLPFVDPQRVGLLGGSHGGHVMVRVMARVDTRGAILCAPANLDEIEIKKAVGRGEKIIRPLTRFVDEMEKKHGVTMEEIAKDPKKYHYNSPLTEVAQVRCPVLFISGRNDVASPASIVAIYVQKLKEAGKQVETYQPDNGPHGFYFGHPDLSETREAAKRAVAFFQKQFRAAK